MDDIIQTVRTFILDRFLPGEDPAALTPTTPLMSSGILTSLATLELVAYLEDHYHIEMSARDTDPSRMGTLVDIAKTVDARRSGGS